MKQKYSQSNDEISRLKRENADIHNEIKECVSMFKNADKFYRSKLNEHIGFLKSENTRLSEKLKLTQLEMDSLAKTQGINWLSSMLKYCEYVINLHLLFLFHFVFGIVISAKCYVMLMNFLLANSSFIS